MTSSEVHGFKKFRIPLVEINRATRNFKSLIGSNQYGEVYKGQLSGRWQNRLATITRNNEWNQSHELEIISIFHHENIIGFIGYCGDVNDRIMVHEYATNGRLDKYLTEEKKRYYLTWAQRLRICIGAAKGLNYLHMGIGEHGRVIHRDFKSENILLDDNLKAKICGFGLSELVRGNLPYPLVYKPAPFGRSYRDPIYKETSILNNESDVYSYGIVMFEVLTGMLANQERGFGESYPKQKLINMVRRCYDDGLEKLIDPSLRDHIDRRSFLMFANIAYKCISFNIKDRPTMDEIVKKIEEALDIHNQQAASAIAKTSLESKRRFLIPLGDIKAATKNFSEETRIWAGYNMVYKGQLFDHRHDRTAAIKRYPRNCVEAKNMFHNELMLISSFHHENIVPFIGYCDESNEMIIVSEYAINESLYNHLKDPNKRRCITWAKRLNICIGVARGLKYLHSGLGEHEQVIHGDIKSGQILLYENLEAKICGFGESYLVPRNHPDTQVYEGTVGHQYYIDPIYSESGIPKTEMDVYSFGVVLFEILTGMLANQRKRIGDNEALDLINLVRRYFDDGLDMLIDPHIRDEIDARALHTFTKVAYKCISFNIKDRPSTNKIIKRMEEALYIQNQGAASTVTRTDQKLADFQIPLIDINSAIGEKGQETRIGHGGFGVVYKGKPSERWQNRTVAIKCLHPESYQGEHEFRNELKMIFNFNHGNIIPFIGYCDEGEEKIIVFEYASNGSLDCHLGDKDKRKCLTWERRLRICLGAARGLDYLHSGLGEDNRVIHRDVKSGNILLDDNMEAKICDFGLSKSGPINRPHTKVYTNVAGTNFYMDPIYHESGILQKESDVYSFGVVMFELLSGMLAYNRRSFGDGTKPQTLIKLVRRYYDYKPEWLIDPIIRDEIDSRSFNTFKEVAFQCISFHPKERPTMETIMDRIEEALEFQVRVFIS